MTLEIPLVLDRAMRVEEVARPRGKRRKKRGRNKDASGHAGGRHEADEGVVSEDAKVEREEDDEEEDETDDEDETSSATSSASNTPEIPTKINEFNNTSSFTSETGGGELQSRGLLGPRVKGVLVLACKVLEKGERFGT